MLYLPPTRRYPVLYHEYNEHGQRLACDCCGYPTAVTVAHVGSMPENRPPVELCRVCLEGGWHVAITETYIGGRDNVLYMKTAWSINHVLTALRQLGADT